MNQSTTAIAQIKPSIKSALELAHEELDRTANHTYNIHAGLIGLDRPCGDATPQGPSDGVVIDAIKSLIERLREINEKLIEVSDYI